MSCKWTLNRKIHYAKGANNAALGAPSEFLR
eukprot:SAG11_NODE_25281_length_361_cov_0.587786_1_plen_30_part_10